MARILLLLLCFTFHASAQEIMRVVEKKYKSGELASRETTYDLKNSYNPSQQEEKVEVFNKKGELIYTGIRRNYAGHSSVTLTFHTNGGVRTIQASSAPDAGIQWYKSTHELDEDGNVVHFSQQSHDDRVTITQPTMRVQPIEKPHPQENQCATPMQTTTKLVNLTNRKITVLITPRATSGQVFSHVVKPRKELFIGEYINAQQFAVPQTLYDVHIKSGKSAEFKQIDWNKAVIKQEDTSPQMRLYTLFWGL